MKIQKIDIEKEIIEIPNSATYWKTFQNEEYIVQEIKDTYNQKKKCLVKVDDRELFVELIEITDSVLNKKIRKEADKIRVNIQSIAESVKNSIKRLPFWKRLFKLF